MAALPPRRFIRPSKIKVASLASPSRRTFFEWQLLAPAVATGVDFIVDTTFQPRPGFNSRVCFCSFTLVSSGIVAGREVLITCLQGGVNVWNAVAEAALMTATNELRATFGITLPEVSHNLSVPGNTLFITHAALPDNTWFDQAFVLRLNTPNGEAGDTYLNRFVCIENKPA